MAEVEKMAGAENKGQDKQDAAAEARRVCFQVLDNGCKHLAQLYENF